jgi:hypothetical protein
MKVITIMLTVLAAGLAAGCGGDDGTSGTTTAAQGTTSGSSSPRRQGTLDRALTPAEKHQVASLNRDIDRMRRAVRHAKLGSELSTPAVQRATSDFLDHIHRRGNLPIYTQTKLLRVAGGVVAPYCGTCFDWIESSRPVVGATVEPPSSG